MDQEHFQENAPEEQRQTEDSNNGDPMTASAAPVVPEATEFNMKREIWEWAQVIIVAVVIAYVIRHFVFAMVMVDGQSMMPTLHHQDRLVVTRLFYKPHTGDIIVFTPEKHAKTPYVKRVVAVPGQTVNIDFIAHKVYVDGVEQNEPFIAQPTANRGDVVFPQKVPAGHVFVMGDNRNNSRDSRFSDVGMVTDKSIMGKAVFRVWPFDNRFGSLYNRR